MSTTTVGTVEIIVPAGIDDPTRPSGGNVYDRRICQELADAGWTVHEHAVDGSWPHPEPTSEVALASVISRLPDHAIVVIDGLIASAAAEVLVPVATRLHLVVLVHMPLGGPAAPAESVAEGAVLASARRVLTTSGWTRDFLVDHYRLDPSKIIVARPGVDAADLAPGTLTGGNLLCVATVAEHKGHDLLVAALTDVALLSWQCCCVGSLDREPEFVAGLRLQARSAGIENKINFNGSRTGCELDQVYAAADVLVLASRKETYGMVVTEALARGIPVIAPAVGGLPEALGRTGDGRLPGILVPVVDDLAEALRDWLTDAELRARTRRAARDRRAELVGWDATSAQVIRALTQVSR